MNDRKIEEIKSAVKELMTLIVQRGKPLSPHLKSQLSVFLERIAERIEELRGSVEESVPAGPLEPPQNPEVPSAQYPSSNINGFKYDPKSQNLLIQFHGPYPKAAGPIYSYKGVPSFIYEVLARGSVGPKTSGKNRYHQWHRGVTPSHGAAVHALIKAGAFPYRKVA